MALRAEVDPDLCMSSGLCVANEPASFRFDDVEIAEAVDGAQALDRDRLIAVARSCPAAAIVLTDGDEIVELD